MIQFISHAPTSNIRPNALQNADTAEAKSKPPLLDKLSGVRQATLSFNKAESKGNIPVNHVRSITEFCGNEEIATIGKELSFRKALMFSKMSGVTPPENEDSLLPLIKSPETSKEDKSLFGKQLNDMKKYRLKLEKSYDNDRGIRNNIEHAIPQNVLTGYRKGDTPDKEKHLKGEIVNRGLNYFENEVNHRRHISTRWLIAQGEEKHPTVNQETTAELRKIIEEQKSVSDTSNSASEGDVSFDENKNMHYVKQHDLFFESNTGYYYDSKNNLFFDNNGNSLSLINGAQAALVKDVIQHESDRIDYGRDVSSLLRNEADISAALQLNQLGYAHIPEWRKDRDNPRLTKSNTIADESYHHMIQKAESVTFVTGKDAVINEASQEESLIHLTRMDITPQTKLEALLARLTMAKGEYPTMHDLKVSLQHYPFKLPEEYHFLTAPLTEGDKTTPALSGIASLGKDVNSKD